LRHAAGFPGYGTAKVSGIHEFVEVSKTISFRLAFAKVSGVSRSAWRLPTRGHPQNSAQRRKDADEIDRSQQPGMIVKEPELRPYAFRKPPAVLPMRRSIRALAKDQGLRHGEEADRAWIKGIRLL